MYVVATAFAMPAGQKAKLDLATLEQHFHLPMQEVAKKFGVCMTFFKKVCRSLGIKRWPYRKLKSLQHKIETLQASMKEKTEVGQAKVLAEKIDELQRMNILRDAATSQDELGVASDTFDIMKATLEAGALVQGLPVVAAKTEGGAMVEQKEATPALAAGPVDGGWPTTSAGAAGMHGDRPISISQIVKTSAGKGALPTAYGMQSNIPPAMGLSYTSLGGSAISMGNDTIGPAPPSLHHLPVRAVPQFSGVLLGLHRTIAAGPVAGSPSEILSSSNPVPHARLVQLGPLRPPMGPASRVIVPTSAGMVLSQPSICRTSPNAALHNSLSVGQQPGAAQVPNAQQPSSDQQPSPAQQGSAVQQSSVRILHNAAPPQCLPPQQLAVQPMLVSTSLRHPDDQVICPGKTQEAPSVPAVAVHGNTAKEQSILDVLASIATEQRHEHRR